MNGIDDLMRLKRTLEDVMIDSRAKKNKADNADDGNYWTGHIAATHYALMLIRQIQEPDKRHTTGPKYPIYPYEDHKPCPHCDGTGINFRYGPEPDQYEPCTTCGGSGRAARTP